MNALPLDLAFGFHNADHWIGRYTRFQAKLPPGRHRLTGQLYCPPLPDGSGNRVLVALHDRALAEIIVPPDAGWQPFDIPLPAVSEELMIDVMLRTAGFIRPPPPDERILGVMLKALSVQIED